MPKLNVHQVNNLTDFTRVIEQLATASKAAHPAAPFLNNWYRGVPRAKTYRLVPHLYRHPDTKKIDDSLKLEKEMRDHFSRHSVLHEFGKIGGLTKAAYELAFYMQHYGVPTRLLDWTYNPYIALFFALSDANVTTSQGAAVWVLDPTLWNSVALAEADKTWGNAGPVFPSLKIVESYFPDWDQSELNPADVAHKMYDLPIAVLGASSSARIFAQKGAFTCFGKKMAPMEKVYETTGFPDGALTQVLVPANKITPMLEMLLSIGYTDSVSYPDVHGLVLEIKRLNGFRT